MRKFIIWLFRCFMVSLLLPVVALAANVGFVPSTGIWFSKTELVPHEMVRVYTAIFNNDYYSLSGTVVFYDNSSIIDTVQVKNVPKETAQQLKVLWEPTEGAHAISARFTKAVATDVNGVTQVLSLNTINDATGAPLKIGVNLVEPTVTSQSNKISTSSPEVVVGATQVEITKVNNKLVLNAKTVDQASTQPMSDTSVAESAGRNGQTTTSVDDIFSKNREILEKSGQLVIAVSSTAGKVSAAYDSTKSAIATGQSWYDKGAETWQKVDPYFQQAKPIWNKISNNNEPKRIAIIVGGLIIGCYILKFAFRRRRYQEFN